MKKQLLDPLGTLCRLVALNFNEIHTKVSVQNHILTLQKPSDYQPIVRLYNGDGRENISELYYVIIRVVKWFLVPEDDDEYMDTDEFNEEATEFISGSLDSDDKPKRINNFNSYEISKSKELHKMVKYLCDAFKKLQETYEYGNVILALQFYINILEDGLKGEYNNSHLPKYILNKDKEYETLLDYDKLRNLWDVKKINRICELYDCCFDVYTDPDTPDDKKDQIIDGYLRSIDAILDITDKEFQKLISNSNRG
jgi:hypothetical protein